MLSHQHEVTQMVHREYVQQLADDAQHPMQSVSLPSHSFGISRALARLASFAHIGSVPRHRGADLRS
jgi:hypothetical protein